MAQKQLTSFPSLVYWISTLVINRPTWRSFYGLDHAGLVSYSVIEFPAVDITILVAEFGYIVTVNICVRTDWKVILFDVNKCFVLVGTSNCCGTVWLVANCPVDGHLPSGVRILGSLVGSSYLFQIWGWFGTEGDDLTHGRFLHPGTRFIEHVEGT